MARGVGRPKKGGDDVSVRKQRKKKDKNAPKRALSAFMFFSNAIRDTVKREMPELEFLQISSEIGRRWKEITPEERRQYDELAAADKQRYQEEKDEYVPDPSFDQGGRGSRKKKDPNAPKRPLSAYFFFCNDVRESVRAENPNKKVTEIAQILAEKWRALPDKKRVKYQKMNEEAKVKYEGQMNAYNSVKNGDVIEHHDEEEEEEEVDEDDDEEEEDDE